MQHESSDLLKVDTDNRVEILLALWEREKLHGNGIRKHIEDERSIEIAPATFYRAIDDLINRALITIEETYGKLRVFTLTTEGKTFIDSYISKEAERWQSYLASVRQLEFR